MQISIREIAMNNDNRFISDLFTLPPTGLQPQLSPSANHRLLVEMTLPQQQNVEGSSSYAGQTLPQLTNLLPELSLSLNLSPDQWRLIENPMHAKDCFNLLDEFRLSGFLCDIEIVVHDQSFQCHKVVLASSIPYFRSMFSSEMIETRQKTVEIRDISSRAFDLLLQYAYKGSVRVTDDNAQPLLYAASILQIDHVCRACESFLTHYLTVDNCLQVRRFAGMHNCQDLINSVDRFVRENFQTLRKNVDFLQIGRRYLSQLLSDDDLNVEKEEQVFETLMNWLDESPDERMQLCQDLLPKVRLTQLSLDFLMKRVLVNPIIEKNVTCLDIATKALQRKYVQSGFGPPCSMFDDLMVVWDSTSRPRKSMAGVIFCVGGRGTNGDPFRSVEAYDWRRNRWNCVSDMHIKRRHVGVIAAYSRLYAIGGHDGIEHLNSVEVFDPALNCWKHVSPMEKGRRGIAVGFLEGAIYAVGGLDDTACFRDVERYNIRADKWEKVASMNVQRGGVGVSALTKFLYAVGGNDGSTSLDSCERYDPHLNEWTKIASMTHRRAGSGVAVLNGHLYAIGGFDDNAPLATCERYDPETDNWRLVAPMSCPRGGVGVAALGGRLFAVGGHDGYHYLNSVEAYDPFNDSWTHAAVIGQCRAGAGVTWCQCAVDQLAPPAAVTVANCV